MSGALKIWYIDGSPYARIVRAMLLEWAVPHDAECLAAYPPAGVERLSPALQVPVLETGSAGVGHLFGSALIRAYLHEVWAPGRDGADRDGLSPILERAEARWRDAQVLTAIETLTDALVLYFHTKWAGLGPVGENRLGCDMIEREMARARNLLDWLEATAEAEAGFRPGPVSAPDLALAACLLWTEAREPIPWADGRPRLARIVERVAARPAVAATAPVPWSRETRGD
ncbi:MAG: hypothetical protein ACFBSD_13690 [Paracoccaceae bacterium]